MRIVLILLAGLGLAMFSAPVQAQSLEGSWRGGGTVHYEGGVEQVRCRVHFEKGSGRTFTFTASCATAGGRYEESGRVVKLSGNRYTGSVYNAQHNVSGKVTLFVRGAQQSVTVTNPKGSAKLVLRRD